MDTNDLREHIEEDGIKFNPNGKGAVVEVNEEFLTNMMSTDHPECRFKREDVVYKAVNLPGDIHDIDTAGVVKGTIFEKTIGEAYLVLFQGDEHMCFTTGAKLKAEKS